MTKVALRKSLCILLALFLLALVPRVLDLGVFLTVDEPSPYADQTRNFLLAVLKKDWAATNQMGNPGATTVLAGSIGLVARYLWLGVKEVSLQDFVASVSLHPFDPHLLPALRLPFAVITALSVLGVYGLAKKLFDEKVALLSAILLAFDPFYLAWKAREVDYETKFIELAGEINTLMPYYVVTKATEALNERKKSIKGAKILILGIAYKEDVDDQRESPALKIISLLQKSGAEVSYNDPYVPHSFGHRDYPGLSLKSVALSEEKLKEFDAVIVATAHSAYDFEWIVKNSSLVIDTRNAIKKKRNNVVKA